MMPRDGAGAASFSLVHARCVYWCASVSMSDTIDTIDTIDTMRHLDTHKNTLLCHQDTPQKEWQSANSFHSTRTKDTHAPMCAEVPLPLSRRRPPCIEFFLGKCPSRPLVTPSIPQLPPSRPVAPFSPHLKWVLCSVLPVVFRCY